MFVHKKCFEQHQSLTALDKLRNPVAAQSGPVLGDHFMTAIQFRHNAFLAQFILMMLTPKAWLKKHVVAALGSCTGKSRNIRSHIVRLLCIGWSNVLEMSTTASQCSANLLTSESGQQWLLQQQSKCENQVHSIDSKVCCETCSNGGVLTLSLMCR